MTHEDMLFGKFEVRMDTVEKQGVELSHRMASVEGTLRSHGNKMDGLSNKLDLIIGKVTHAEAAPKTDLVKVLTVTKDLAILTGFVATLLGFIITSYTSSEREMLKYRVGQLEKMTELSVQRQNKTDRVN